MSMMSQTSYENLNNLLAMCFNANAVVDNLAYCLDFHYYSNIAKVVHLKVAHEMPVLADIISDKMLELMSRPVRKDINGYEKDYEDPKDIFDTLRQLFYSMREAVRNLIEDADIEGDDEVRIFGEEFLVMLTKYVKQADEWCNAANKLDANTLNIHINDYTHFIDE